MQDRVHIYSLGLIGSLWLSISASAFFLDTSHDFVFAVPMVAQISRRLSSKGGSTRPVVPGAGSPATDLKYSNTVL